MLLLSIQGCMIMLKPEKNSDETLIILSIRKSTEILEKNSLYVLIISFTLWKGSAFTWEKQCFGCYIKTASNDWNKLAKITEKDCSG